MSDTPFDKHLDCIQDPRRHNIRHQLYDMLMIALCATISGADSWTQGERRCSWPRSSTRRGWWISATS